MKSVVIKEAKKFEIKDMPEPKSKKGSVVVNVTRAGICGSDIHNWESAALKGVVPGHEFVGVVTDPGSRKDLKVGDRVTALPISPCGKCEACLTGNPQYCRDTWTYGLGLSSVAPGAFAPKTTFRADMFYKVPDNVTDDEAALTEPIAVSLHAVHLANIKIGAKVLVVGGGIIGLGCAMFAKLNGASYVAVSETNPTRGKKAVQLKVADEYLNALDKDFVTTAVTKSQGGFDVVLECVGNAPAVNSAVMAVKPGGTVVLVGINANPINFYSIVSVVGEQTIKGSAGYTKEEFAKCLELMGKKIINVKKFVSKTVGLTGVQSAFEDLYSGKTSSIKILIDPNL